jgi:hypothetical protein
MAKNVYNIIFYIVLQIIIYIFQFSPTVKFEVCIFLSPFLPFGKINLLPQTEPPDSAVQTVRLHQVGSP